MSQQIPPGNKRFDPIESMATARHEFGEHGGVNLSIEASTTFTVMSADTMPAMFQGRYGPEAGGCYLYGRHFNPTVYAFGRQLAAMEGTQNAYCTASGMSAIACALMQFCSTGDHIVSSNTIYGGTFALLKEFLPAKTGVQSTMVDIHDHVAVERAFTSRTKVLYAETIANPTLVVADIPKLADIAHRHGAALVIDNTFCPLIVAPAQLGADVVVHSLTKFISGGSDIIAGAICASNEFILKLMDLHSGSLMLLGPTMDPHTAFNLSLRIPHLGLRMQAHSERAAEFTRRLKQAGWPVTYTGDPTHPQYELLKSIANPNFGLGGLLTLDMGTEERAKALMENLQNEQGFGYMAVSLGYFDTLLSCSGSTTSSEMSPEDKAVSGISPGLVRMSVGFTGSLEQRWNQLAEALSVIGHNP